MKLKNLTSGAISLTSIAFQRLKYHFPKLKLKINVDVAFEKKRSFCNLYFCLNGTDFVLF